MTSTKGAPQVVSIIVYGAKGLKPKKDKHKFCVIFGIGKSKFRTDIVEDLFDNPVFNKEIEITVDSLDQELKFKVTEKHEKDVLGQVVVQLDELGNHNTSSPHKVPLRPHKKCPTPNGLLIFEAWITAKKVEKVPSKSSSMESLKSIKSLGLSSGLKKLKDRITTSSKSSDSKNKKNSSESLFTLKTRNAISCQDVTRESPFYIPTDRRSLHSDAVDSYDGLDTISEFSEDYQKRNSSNLEKVSEFICPKPEVTSVSPKSGPETGGTVLTIRGSNLGQSHEDIGVLNICGSDVLATLEYISPWKLQCETVPWKACIGGIVIETLSGGRGLSLVEFAFSEVEKRKTSSVSDRTSLHSIPEDVDSTEMYASRYEDAFNSSGVGFAVSYSDSLPDEVTSIGAGITPNVPSDSRLKPSAEISDEQNEEDGIVSFSAKEERMTMDNESEGSSSQKEKDVIKGKVGKTSATQSEFGNSESVSEETTNQENKGSAKFRSQAEKEKMDGHSAADNKSKESVQINIIPTSPDPEVRQEKLDNRSTVVNGAAIKQPPPIGEIQPMRMDDSSSSMSSSNPSTGYSAPRKPPRHPEKQIYARNGVNEMSQMSSHQTKFIQDDSLTGQSILKDQEIIRDLETQLDKKTNEIEILVGVKKSLQDENWRLKRYIDVLISRAISICPEVLCVDDSSHA